MENKKSDLPAPEFSQLTYGYSIGGFSVDDNIFPLSPEDQRTLDAYHNMYFRLLEKKSGLQISWLGYQTGKVPSDLWIYQEMITTLRPDVIVELGTHCGGSALYLASMCQLVGTGRVITVDLYPKPNRPLHHLIEYVNGSSTDKHVVAEVKSKINNAQNVLVILDSNHQVEHVLTEMESYCDLVPVGGYLIVEDTFLNGHPSHLEHGPGPTEAIELFFQKNDSFIIDKAKERFLFTLNRNGFLKRIK